MGGESAKVLLDESIQRRYRKFTLNDDVKLSLPALSAVPWIGASKRRDVFRKERSHDAPHHLKFITKNGDPQAFIWQTDAEKLKQAVRWGIVKTHSITSKVISVLGQYRIVAHERVIKGLVSNTQAAKLKLLDLYQDRFTALQALESLVNKDTTPLQYQTAFAHYIAELQRMEDGLDDYFAEVDCGGLNEKSLKQIKADIQADKIRAQMYLDSLKSATDLRPYNRSRGEKSVLEFVKQQMIQGLYELQGVNQDMTYSWKRYFALTRGELNDFIEDARKEIDEHEADARNAVTGKHHGHYAANENEMLAYDFSRDDLSPMRERQVLTAISFIEGWDVLENKKGQEPFVSNGSAREPLETYAATRWRTHRSVGATIKSVGSFVLNIVKGIFVATRPWEEEDWANEDFHLHAVKLREHAKPMEPLWKKPVSFLMQIGYALADVFNGIRDFGKQLIVTMPEDIVNDWESSKPLPTLGDVLVELTQTCNDIVLQEKETLNKILTKSDRKFAEKISPPTAKLTDVEYELSGGEFNDIFNSVIRGVHGFSTVFTHSIYAKDPVGGLVFTATYLAGIGMVYLPTLSASIFGSGFVTAFNNISYAMASSSLGAAIAGASTLAEIFAVVWDGFLHGPSGIAVNTLYQFGEDPLTIGAYAVAAYALGYFLANGIGGHQIPWLSHLLQEDLGTDPSTGYPIIGAKFAVLLYESLLTHPVTHHEQPDLIELEHDTTQTLSEERARTINRFKLVFWLAAHAKTLPKLAAEQKFALARQLDDLFTKEHSASLKKLIYPESHPSIAFQIFAIPLSYVPAILRLAFSPVLGFAAWVKGNPNPGEPMRQAGTDLLVKVKKDLSRFIVMATNLTYLLYNWATVFIKMIAVLFTLAVGRVAGVFDGKPAHAMHRLFAWVHNLMRSIGEFFYPARAVKSVLVAHPTDTMRKTEGSYVTLLEHIGKEKGADKSADSAVEKNMHSDFSLLTPSADKTQACVSDMKSMGSELSQNKSL